MQKKLISYYTDNSQELLEVSQTNMLKDFEAEQKVEKREEVACRIFLYCWAGLCAYLLVIAIIQI
jgi:hypothetical protein